MSRLSVAVLLSLTVALNGCSTSVDVGGVEISQVGFSVCVPADESGIVTVGVTMASAEHGAVITGVELDQAENLRAIGFRISDPDEYIGADLGFEPGTGPDAARLPADTDRAIEVGVSLEDPTRSGHSETVTISYETPAGRGSVRPMARIAVTAAGGSCT